ncbi:MAG: Mth938-like domain-containing protein, partial [Rhodospirillaceae bacterium]|nr:Mth938-like domain-containing protein [Rhodospirillaceae bacterium]
MAVQLIRQGGGRQIIQRYGNGGFRVSGVAYRGSIVVLPDATQAWEVAAFAALSPAAFADLFARAATLDLCLV